jgi:tripartite-type tricarboxylate transporter receptor subunit TctC
MKKLLLALAMLAFVVPASAQNYPNQTVRIIVPTAAGGSIDAIARIFAERLSAKWGQSVIVENKAGGSMRIGADYAAKAPADGYTLLFCHDGTLAVNAVAFRDLPYDPVKDFEPLGIVAYIPVLILANSDFPPKNMRELIDYAKKNPGKVNHATGGTSGLLDLELLKAMAGIDITSVSYRGGLPGVQGTMAGDVEITIADVMTSAGALQSGKIRALAVATKRRVKQLPDVPTADESGVPGYDVSTWVGAFAPAGTPKEVSDKIEEALREAVTYKSVQDKLGAVGIEVASGRADDMRNQLALDLDKWKKLVKEQNIHISP